MRWLNSSNSVLPKSKKNLNVSWSRSQVLKDSRFYQVIPGLLASPFIITGVFFHQIHLIKIKSWSITLLASSYPFFALSVIGVTFGAGWIVDRFSTVHLLRIFLLPLAFGLLFLASNDLAYAAPIFMILIGASIFSLVFRGLGGEELITEIFNKIPGGLFGSMILVMLLVFILGFILDFIEITFVVVPIVGPVLLAMGLDPIWLGVMIAINLQTSFLTPPFGFALFYLRGVAPPSVATSDMYKGVIPFILIQILVLIAISIWPAIAIWLPGTL